MRLALPIRPSIIQMPFPFIIQPTTASAISPLGFQSQGP